MKQASEDNTSIALRMRAYWHISGYSLRSKLPAGELLIRKNGRIEFVRDDGSTLLSVPLCLTYHEFHNTTSELELIVGSRWYFFYLTGADRNSVETHDAAKQRIEALDFGIRVNEVIDKYSDRAADDGPIIAARGPRAPLLLSINPIPAYLISGIILYIIFSAVLLGLRGWLTDSGIIHWLYSEYGGSVGVMFGISLLPLALPGAYPGALVFNWVYSRFSPKQFTLTEDDILPPHTQATTSFNVLQKRRKTSQARIWVITVCAALGPTFFYTLNQHLSAPYAEDPTNDSLFLLLSIIPLIVVGGLGLVASWKKVYPDNRD